MSYKYGVGISHLEFWVKDMEESVASYSQLFPLIGWHALTRTSYSCGVHKIYFKEMPVPLRDSLGVRHICFHATSRGMVDAVGEWLQSNGGNIIRGPQPLPQYDISYYTVDFRDPNGFVLEVAHAPDSKL